MKLLSKYEFLKADPNSLIQTISGIFSQNSYEVHSLLKIFVAFACTLSSTAHLIEKVFNICPLISFDRNNIHLNICIYLIYNTSVRAHFPQTCAASGAAQIHDIKNKNGGFQHEIYRYAPSHHRFRRLLRLPLTGILQRSP